MNRTLIPVLAFASFLSVASTATRSFAEDVSSKCYSTPASMSDSGKMPKFDVVSVKEVTHPLTSTSFSLDPDGIRISGSSLQYLIHRAYGTNLQLISGGPKWVESTMFEIRAKITESEVARVKALSQDERNMMLRSILKDRFGLTFHCEQRKNSVYELIPAKSGTKLKLHPEDNAPGSLVLHIDGRMKGTNVLISALISHLQTRVKQVVLDKTGLTGHYDFEIISTPGNELSAPQSQTDAADTPTASLFTALQEQLGLKLIPVKAMVDVLVIDDAHMPNPD